MKIKNEITLKFKYCLAKLLSSEKYREGEYNGYSWFNYKGW